MALGELGVGVKRVARDVERRYPQAGMLDGLFQLPDGVGVTEQLVGRAVGDWRVPADTQLQVLDQASPRRPAGDIAPRSRPAGDIRGGCFTP